jgi:hypothetical protein
VIVDGPAIAAGWDIVKQLGSGAARELLAVLELPDEARWAVWMTMFQKEETATIGEILGDIEQDTTGQTRQHLIAGLRAALD